MHKPLRLEEISLLDTADFKGYSVNGTPSDCVKLAVEAVLKEKPDLVISGINRGSNLGTDVLYSGTVSAAVEGLLLGIPSIAVSLTGSGESANFNYAARFARELADKVLNNSIESLTLININVPVDTDAIKGTRVTRLGTRRYQNAFEKRTDPRGNLYYWLAGELVADDPESDDCDTRAIKDGYISVTPIHFKLTNEAAMPALEKLISGIN